ncbi:LacI family DNA-binding transcriptional regulator [Virgibacillus oceani]
MKVTMEDVAKAAGVSKTTVSRIINGNYQYVTEDTKLKVLKIIKELDYRPNAIAKGLKQMKTNVIGIVLSNLQNPFWSSVLDGVEDRCQSLNYNLMICNSKEDAKLEAEHIKGLRVRQVDGLIMNPTMKNEELYKEIAENNDPFVSINRKIPGLNIKTITINNVQGAKLAVDHLLKIGRNKIAILVYPYNNISPRLERIEGYKKAIKNFHEPVEYSYVHEIEETKGVAKEQVKKLLKEDMAPNAILSTNNMMTLEILEGIKESGLKVPDDISVIGYDETVWSMHLNPPLTTVSQPAYEMGGLAAEQLIDLIENKKHNQANTVELEPKLIKRVSCGHASEKL